MSMNLVELETQDEFQFFSHLVGRKIHNKDVKILIGATDIGSESSFYWSTNAWKVDYPVKWIRMKNHPVAEDGDRCSEFVKNRNGCFFRRVPCSGYKQNFACQMDHNEFTTHSK